MFEQSLQNYNAAGADRTQHAIARDEDGFLVAAKRGDPAAFAAVRRRKATAECVAAAIETWLAVPLEAILRTLPQAEGDLMIPTAVESGRI